MIIPRPDGIVRDMQKPGVVSEYLNNLVIAKSIAQVVLRLPWIADMSAGSFQEKVTYGRGGHVSGVVLRYTELGASAVEVGVVIAEKVLFEAEALSPASERSSNLETVPILLRLANQLRSVIYHTTQDLGLSVITEINVSIDDIR
jgi:hypothetical protein